MITLASTTVIIILKGSEYTAFSYTMTYLLKRTLAVVNVTRINEPGILTHTVITETGDTVLVFNALDHTWLSNVLEKSGWIRATGSWVLGKISEETM